MENSDPGDRVIKSKKVELCNADVINCNHDAANWNSEPGASESVIVPYNIL